MRRSWVMTLGLSCTVVLMLTARPARTQTQAAVPADATRPSVVGVWRLNPERSDAAPVPPDGPGRDGRDPNGAGRGGFGRGRGRGGFGGPGRGGRTGEPDEARMRRLSAVRDLLDTPERLTITATESMVIVTAGDGRTTRMLTDGSAVKDDSTNITRSTRWVNGRIVSQLSGLVLGKATETYAPDPSQRRLTVTIWVERAPGPPRERPDWGVDDPARGQATAQSDARGAQKGAERGRTFTRVYDRDPES